MTTMERLGSMDMTWLQIDRDTNLLHVIGVMIFETPLARVHLEDLLRHRLLGLERFGQHVLLDSAGAVWESEHVDLPAHIEDITLPADEDPKAALQRLVGKLAGTPLDLNRPLWRIHLVNNYMGGSALIARVHHCLADSIALIGLLQSLTADAPGLPGSAPAGSAEVAAPSLFGQIYAPLTQAMIDGIKLSGAVWAKYWSLLFYPQQLFDYARTHAALTLEIGKLVGLTDDTPTLFKGRPLGTKRASWSERLTLSAVQAVARAHQATPDAVLLSCLAGALRNFLEAQGAPTDGVELRTLMPVNLRNADAREVLGNRGGMLALELPVGIKDPLARLHEVERRMEVFQEAYQAANTLGLFNLIGQASRAARDAVLQLIATKASALFCHIPASPTPRYLNGVKIVEQMFWSPASGELGLSMSILSYDGHYQVGLIADAAMLPDPNLITGRIADELAALTPAAPDAPKPAAKPPGKPRARKAAP